jgi:uncharacterized membrane protein YebE (DUF533 family)
MRGQSFRRPEDDVHEEVIILPIVCAAEKTGRIMEAENRKFMSDVIAASKQRPRGQRRANRRHGFAKRQMSAAFR